MQPNSYPVSSACGITMTVGIRTLMLLLSRRLLRYCGWQAAGRVLPENRHSAHCPLLLLPVSPTLSLWVSMAMLPWSSMATGSSEQEGGCAWAWCQGGGRGGAAVQTAQMLPQPGLLAVYGAGTSFSWASLASPNMDNLDNLDTSEYRKLKIR